MVQQNNYHKSLDTESKITKVSNTSFSKCLTGLLKIKTELQNSEKNAKNVINKFKEMIKISFVPLTKAFSEVRKWLDKVKAGGDNAKNSLSNLSRVRFGGVTSSLSAVVGWLDKVKNRATVAKNAVSQVNRARSRTIENQAENTVATTSDLLAETTLDNYSTSLMRNSVNLNNFKTSGGFYQVQDIMNSSMRSSIQADVQQNELISLLVRQNELLLKMLNKENVIEVGVNVDGRQIAKSSARYMETEINKIKQRKTRIGGIA